MDEFRLSMRMQEFPAFPNPRMMNFQNQRRFNSDGRRGFDDQVPQPHVDFSVDDGGMDEYDVAEERVNMFEYVNPDNMTYEELLALQERIGFVNKGLPRQQIEAIPQMLREDVGDFIDNILFKRENGEDIDDLEESKHLVSEERPERERAFLRGCEEEEEEGMENCNEEDEERKEEEMPRGVVHTGTVKDGVDQSQLLSVSSAHRERCAICFEGMRSRDLVRVLKCCHYYHSGCIEQWLVTEKRCPMCMTYL